MMPLCDAVGDRAAPVAGEPAVDHIYDAVALCGEIVVVGDDQEGGASLYTTTKIAVTATLLPQFPLLPLDCFSPS